MMTRRNAVIVSTGLALAPAGRTAAATGRLKQSVARWCYARMPMEDLCRQAAAMGLVGIDLVDPPDWPTIKKYGLTPAMVTGAGPKHGQAKAMYNEAPSLVQSFVKFVTLDKLTARPELEWAVCREDFLNK